MTKRTKKILAMILGISTIAASMHGGTAYAGDNTTEDGVQIAQESTEIQATDSDETADAIAENATEEGLKENSWRYENGNPIATVELYAEHPNAWQKVNGSFLNSVGAVIPGAIKKGVDVSEHQGKIDWEKVKADGVDFAIIRCGYGSDFTSQDDKTWAYNTSECERLGIPYGVYLYSYATNTAMAKSEAEHTLRLLRGRTITYPVYYDLEENAALSVGNKMLGQMAKTYCDLLQANGYKVGVYANLNWWTNHLTDGVFNNTSWSKWVAQYNTTCDYASKYDIWQSTSKGKVNGITGNTDINFLMESANPFYDVQWNSWFFDPVMYVLNNGYMKGLNANVFGPSEKTSRGQLVTILHRMEGTPSVSYAAQYPDVASGMFYTDGVMWATKENIVHGYDDGYYGPADAITREQMVTMMYRYAEYKGHDVSTKGDLSKFPDRNKVSSFSKEAMEWAVGVGIITGNADGTLAPTAAIDRAACATIIMRFHMKLSTTS